MSGLQTEYEFVLPRGYVDGNGALHKRGVMRLATARDELEPLRDPTITSPDDPRLTVLVLARVVRRLGSLELVTTHEIEGLFAADLAYLQDFYGVVNFGTRADIEALLQAQAEAERSQAVQGAAAGASEAAPSPAGASEPGAPPASEPAAPSLVSEPAAPSLVSEPAAPAASPSGQAPSLVSEPAPSATGASANGQAGGHSAHSYDAVPPALWSRRSAIEEVPARAR